MIGKSFELQNPEELKYVALKDKENDKKKKEQRARAPTAELVAAQEKQKLLGNFDRFDEQFVDTYMEERRLQRLPAKNAELQDEKPLEEFISDKNIEEFSKVERLSKRLARMGVSSRRQAEKLMAAGMVKVDGEFVTSNCPVTSASLI